jgi:hypothetical protein
LEFLSILKVFGVALLVIVGLGSAIAIWEQVISKTQLWNKISNKFLNHPKADTNPGETPSLQDQPPDEQRSILPILLVIAGLGLFAILDTSSLLSSNPQTSSNDPRPDPTHIKSSSPNTSVIQFSSAVLTLGVVIGFIVFNKDEYRAWKARRRLSKQYRRRARQTHSLNSPPR